MTITGRTIIFPYFIYTYSFNLPIFICFMAKTIACVDLLKHFLYVKKRSQTLVSIRIFWGIILKRIPDPRSYSKLWNENLQGWSLDVYSFNKFTRWFRCRPQGWRLAVCNLNEFVRWFRCRRAPENDTDELIFRGHLESTSNETSYLWAEHPSLRCCTRTLC